MILSHALTILTLTQTCFSHVVRLNHGYLTGERFCTVFDGKCYAGFVNIRYAKPPLGELRFKPPVPEDSWRNNTVNDDHVPSSIEDCLYLSIFMPLDANRLPVLVWIHEHSSCHSPDFFIDEDILVVAVSFRTGIFGFLNTNDDFAEGNMGVKDIVSALKWVKHNIHHFNGDPDRITVAGAGLAAAPVASMLLHNNETFARVIVSSGSAVSPADYNDFKIDDKLFNKLNEFKTFNRKELNALLESSTADRLLSASQEMFDSTEVRDNQRFINPFGCSVEIGSKDPFLIAKPIEMYERKAVNNVPILIGYTSLHSLYKLNGIASNRKLLKHLNYNFQYVLPFEGRMDEYNSDRYKQIRERIMEFYFVNGTITERSLRRYAKYLTDVEIFPVMRHASLQREISEGPVYLYRFAFKGSFNVGWQPNLNWSGASLDDEICYLFKCKSLSRVYSRVDAVEREFIKTFVRLLANFIKYGNPTPDSKDELLKNIHWSPLTKGPLNAMNFNKRIRMRNVPEEERMRFWYKIQRDFFRRT